MCAPFSPPLRLLSQKSSKCKSKQNQMHTRTFQEDALREEGYNLERVKDSRTQPWYGLKDPRNKTLPNRQVVDCSPPANLIDETHQGRHLGVIGMNGLSISLQQISNVKQQVEGGDTNHRKDLRWPATLVGGVLGLMSCYGKMGIGGNRATLPKVGFAGMIWMVATITRFSITGAILSTYFDVYEFLYKDVPWFRIDDPSDDGWAQPWKEGQSTYRARIGASVTASLAALFFTGSVRRMWGCFSYMANLQIFYEFARITVNPGMRLFYSFQANKEMQRQAAFGSLMPNLERRNDPDTGKTEQAHQHRYFQVTTGLLRDQVWENNTHENLPLHTKGMKIPNPYFNWQKAKQMYSAKQTVYKNDLWAMPEVLGSRMRSGALDIQ